MKYRGFFMYRLSACRSPFAPFLRNVPSVNAVLGRHVTAGLANYVDLVGHIQAGNLRTLVTVTPSRVEALPDSRRSPKLATRSSKMCGLPSCCCAAQTAVRVHNSLIWAILMDVA